MRKQAGFTLIELMIVIAIIAIIAAIAIPNLLNAIDRGKQKRTMADIRSLGTAVETYSIDNNDYPVAATMAHQLASNRDPVFKLRVPASRIVGGELSWGEFTYFWMALALFLRPIRELSERFNILQAALAAAERIFSVLDEAEEEPDALLREVLGAAGLWLTACDPASPAVTRRDQKIIDRAKDVGKLNDGSMFAPKYLENKLKFFPFIKEAVCFGDGWVSPRASSTR